jgi:hypothetical protein
MSIMFNPNGVLDVASDPSDLPQTVDKFNIASDSMQRCKNLRLDRNGMAKVRDGSTKLNSSAVGTPIYRIIEQAGVRYTFASTQIYKDESSIATGLTSAMWSGILYNPWNSTTQSVYALNGTDRKRIEGSNVYEWGITAPSTVPVIAAGAGSSLTGSYNAKYTYARLEGSTVVSESDPSGAAAANVSLTSSSLSITWTASSDSQVTHAGVYRTLSGGAIWYLDQYVAIGTTTLDSTKTDSNLSTEVATNHDRPPLGSYTLGPTYNGVCFIIINNLLYYSLAKQPEYWPLTNFIEVSPIQFPLKTMVFHSGQLYCLSKNKIYFIQGTGQNTFFPFKMESLTGAQGPNCAISVHGEGIYHVGTDGLYLYNQKDINMTQSKFKPIFRGTTVNGIPGAGSLTNAWLEHYKNKLYFGYPGANDTYPTNVLVFDFGNGKVAYYDFNQTELSAIAVDETNNRLLAGDENGYIWVLEDTSATQDGSTDVSWEVESKDFTLSTRRHFPRWIRYDIDASNATSVTGTIILDDSTLQSHTVSGDRVTTKRLITTGNGKNCSMRVTGSGPATVYALEME